MLTELVSTMLGGASAGVGQHFANQANVKNAREANAWEQESAQKQMEFQERMSSTAHQRQVEDLKKAGLNPLLSATGGAGASSPSGAGGAGSAATNEDVLGKAVASAGEMYRLGLQTKKQAAEVKNIEETNNLIKDQQAKTKMETTVLKKGIPEAEAKNFLWQKAKEKARTTSEAWKNLELPSLPEWRVPKQGPISINPNK